MSSESLIKVPILGSQETSSPDCEYAELEDLSRKLFREKSFLLISWTRIWLALIYIPAIALFVLSYLRYSTFDSSLYQCARGDDVPCKREIATQRWLGGV
jgi:hypothetical protein